MKEKIHSLDLTYKEKPVSFVILTMEEITAVQGDFADLPHRHNYYSVIWSFTATGKHIIDFTEYPILQGHIFFVSPKQVHQVITDPGSTGLLIFFTPEFLHKNSIQEDFVSNLKLFQDSGETPSLPIGTEMEPKLRDFAAHMKEAFLSDHDMRLETIGAYLRLFLIECNGHCSLFPGANTQNLEVGRTLTLHFKKLVEQHFNELHQVKDYASSLNVTPNYLNEVIRSTIGESAKDYIQNRIILEAKRMLTFTKKSGKEIGYDLGFEDPSHFSKFFKTNTGMALNAFRKVHGNW